MSPRNVSGGLQRWVWIAGALAFTVFGSSAWGAENKAAADFHKDIQPILVEYCYDCHGDGMNKGKVAFDEFKSDAELLSKRDLWLAALKNLRAGLMPPEKKPRPSDQEKLRLEKWIKYEALGIDPKNPDPGRVTIRRLNRVEYRNTIRDLMGFDFKADEEFPPDDTGYGFDNVGDVLTTSPLLLEKYMQAAETIVAGAVPTVAKVVQERSVRGSEFRGSDGTGSGERLTFYQAAKVSHAFPVELTGDYRLVVELEVAGPFDFDPGRCTVIFKVDDEERKKEEFGWQNGKRFRFEFDEKWQPGEHRMAFELQPLTPLEKKANSLDLRITSVKVQGPLDERHWTRTRNYDRFFFKDEPPKAADARRQYAREVLSRFATKAFRRPVDDRTLDRLLAIAEDVYGRPAKRFEEGIAQAMVAVLASPRFLFRVEESESSAALAKVGASRDPTPPPPSLRPSPSGKGESSPGARTVPGASDGPERAGGGSLSIGDTAGVRGNSASQSRRREIVETASLVDEFSLASRLSYFLWSTMPDEELFRLAERRELRKNLAPQVKRMLADARSDELAGNFTGQWLQVRDVDGIAINAPVVLARDGGEEREIRRLRQRLQELQAKPDLTPEEQREREQLIEQRRRRFNRPTLELDGPLRQAMRRESEMFFEQIMREDRGVLELIDSDYTFLNERLARHYGIPDVKGNEMRRVSLPKDHPRGGVLTHGAVLAVTSNPTRTSPVKRGLFILDNILGTPAPPPPPDVPELERAEKEFKDHEPTMREIMEIHRGKPLCNSCHARMDPLGLALENFNALGMWREKERGQAIDTAGRLITGESFQGLRDLKRILTNEHRMDFYRCLTEKLLIYGLGRGLEYYDVETVDQIVERLQKENGRFSGLLMGIIESAPFQKRRESLAVTAAEATRPAINLAGGDESTAIATSPKPVTLIKPSATRGGYVR